MTATDSLMITTMTSYDLADRIDAEPTTQSGGYGVPEGAFILHIPKRSFDAAFRTLFDHHQGDLGKTHFAVPVTLRFSEQEFMWEEQARAYAERNVRLPLTSPFNEIDKGGCYAIRTRSIETGKVTGWLFYGRALVETFYESSHRAGWGS